MTIPLLTPESLKEGSKVQAQEQQARMRSMAHEEERLIRSINDLQRDEREEKERIKEDVARFRNEAHVKILEIDSTIASKKKEVEALEERRAEAMKPIEEVRKEADERNEKSKEREEVVAKREQAAEALADQNLEELEQLNDRRQLQNERDEELDKREEKVKQEEAISKESLAGVNQRWVEFHEAVAKKDKEYEECEARVSAGEQANTIRANELDKVAADQKENERGLQHRYAILEIAEAEFNRKKN